MTDRLAVHGWVERYERAWRTPGTEGLEALFTADASYLLSPYEEPVVGLDAIRRMWDDEREGPDEVFTLSTEIVAVDGDTAVVRAEVRYGEPLRQEYRDLWILHLHADGRCSWFEEWAYRPGRSYSARDAHRTPRDIRGPQELDVPVAGNKSPRAAAEDGEDALFEAAFRTGDFDAAERELDRALAACRGAGDARTEAFVTDRLATVEHYRNITRLIGGEGGEGGEGGRDLREADIAAEEAVFRRALELRESLGDVAGIAQSLFGVGLVHQVLRGDWQTALGYFSRALALAERAGEDLDLYSRSEIHRHLGFFHLVESMDVEKALDHLRTSLELREQLGDERRIPSALVALGQAEAAAGNRSRAIDLLEQAVARARSARLSALWLHDAEQALADALGRPREVG